MKIPKGVLYLGLASFATDVAGEMIYPLLPAFFTEVLGAGVLFLGVFESVSEGVASLAQDAGGRWSDRSARREPFVLWGYAAANAIRPLIGLAASPLQALGLRAADRVGKGLRTPARDAWIAGLGAPENRGALYGFHQAMDDAGAVLGPLLATAFLWIWPGRYRPLFLLTWVPGLAAVYFIARAARVQPAAPVDAPAPEWAPGWGWAPAPFKLYLSLLGLFTLGMASDAFLLLKLKQVGVPAVGIPALWAGLHLVKSSSSAVGGWLSDAWGRKATILSGWLLYALFYAAFGAVERRGLMVALFLLYGVFYGLTEGPEKALVADLAPASRRGEAFGLYHLVTGLGILPASALFGLIWKLAGAPAAFTAVAALSVLCGGLLAVLPIPGHKKPLPA